MKSDKYKLYSESKDFRCPICHSDSNFKEPNSLICENNHCFDIAKQGYINFLSKPPSSKYSKELFEHRRIVFNEGFYLPLLNEIKSLIDKYNNEDECKILDLGCGEGYYISKLKEDPKLDIYGIDNVKDAILLGAKDNKSIKWIVGDLANIPIKSKSLDILLNIFTPSNYKEFLRVLKEAGIIIKIVPGKNYLKELREAAETQLKNQDYSNELVVEYFKENLDLIESKSLSYSLPVSKEHIQSFVEMTPMMFSINKEELNLDNIDFITLDFEIMVGKNK